MVEKLRSHSERNLRLFWLEGISDEYLEKVYAASSCLVTASEGEGFGLPLIEAAQHQLPIIARDIPVFREVAGPHALYFSGFTANDLAEGVQAWLALDKTGQSPQSSTMPWLTWKQSTQSLLNVLLGGQWYKEWVSDGGHRFWGNDPRLFTQVGERCGRDMVSTGRTGYLTYGPYIPLVAGRYRVVIRGTWGESGVAGARVDVAADQGSRILADVALNEPGTVGCLVSLPILLDAPCADLEVRVWVEANSDLRLSMLEIIPEALFAKQTASPSDAGLSPQEKSTACDVGGSPKAELQLLKTVRYISMDNALAMKVIKAGGTAKAKPKRHKKSR